MPSRNELIALYTGLAMQKLLRDNSQSDKDFADIADRARRAATAQVDNIAANVSGFFRQYDESEDAELLRKAYEGARQNKAGSQGEGEDASLESRTSRNGGAAASTSKAGA